MLKRGALITISECYMLNIDIHIFQNVICTYIHIDIYLLVLLNVFMYFGSMANQILSGSSVESDKPLLF